MKDTLGIIGGFILWLVLAVIGIFGIFGWAGLIAGHFNSGAWFLLLLDVIFLEIIIPVMGLIHTFQLIF